MQNVQRTVPGDLEEYHFHQNGQDWAGWWHPPAGGAPDGKRHGSTGICRAEDGRVVVVGHGEAGWGLPGGRPEGDEDWRETLDREVWEEACAVVEDARLLGFARGLCLRGHEEGLVLVRSLWVASVRLEPWEPEFETVERALLEPADALERLLQFDPNPILRRMFQEAVVDLGNVR
jgi:hypothetical protein